MAPDGLLPTPLAIGDIEGPTAFARRLDDQRVAARLAHAPVDDGEIASRWLDRRDQQQIGRRDMEIVAERRAQHQRHLVVEGPAGLLG